MSGENQTITIAAGAYILWGRTTPLDEFLDEYA
jgi:hypothetical protein